MTMTEKIIHIDGADKTGKDTIRDLLVKDSQGKHLIYVRSYISQIVYNRIYGRTINEEFFWKRFKEDYNKGDLFFLFGCNKDIVAERFIKHNETDLDIKDYFDHSMAFLQVVTEARERGIVVIVIDTSTATVDETFSQLKNIIHIL
jgi:thymidylate kinase